jgi:hypothetical protein
MNEPAGAEGDSVFSKKQICADRRQSIFLSPSIH